MRELRLKVILKPFVFERNSILTMEQALDRMRNLIGHALKWSDLSSFLPEGWDVDPQRLRSATGFYFCSGVRISKVWIGRIRAK